jgi:dGTPase
VRSWYLPGTEDAALDVALADLRAVGSWPQSSYDGSRRSLASIKNLTSDLIGRFCGSAQQATFDASGGEPPRRHLADLVVPERTEVEIGVLKGIASLYVMQADDRVALMARQREMVAELVEALWERGPDALDPVFVEDWEGAADDAGRRRVGIDQVASLTDASAVTRHALLTRPRASR